MDQESGSFALAGVVVYEENDLQKQILTRAETRGVTGVSTAASLEAIRTVKADTVSELSRWEGLELSLEEALHRDGLRIRIQLLNRLSLLRTATPSAGSSTVKTTRRVSNETLPRNVVTVDSGEAVLAALTQIGLRQSPEEPSFRDLPAIGRPRVQKNAGLHVQVGLRRQNGLAKVRDSSNSDYAGHGCATAATTVPPAVVSGLADLPQCPLCFRSIADFDDVGIDRHVERCLRRQKQPAHVRHDVPGSVIAHFSPTEGVKSDTAEFDNLFDSEPGDLCDDNAVANNEVPVGGEDLSAIHGRKNVAGRSHPMHTASTRAVRLSRVVRASNVVVDDWNESLYRERLAVTEEEEAELDAEDAASAALDPVLKGADAAAVAVAGQFRFVTLSNGLILPRRISRALLPYQTTGVLWLYELYRRRVGGILGDEMGLGKTVQVAALFGALHTMRLMQQPSLVVCPATIVAHWVRELTTWHPQLRVFVLHGSYKSTTPGNVIDSVFAAATGGSGGHIVVTTYDGLRMHQNLLLPKHWGHVVLDEGHRLRNPDAAVTLVAKQLKTVHRLVLTGAPIQNKLAELWSLFDFVYPGRLGDLPMFEANFAQPIAAGGWTHATAMQVATAHQTAVVLKDTIGPYLLRRLKRDVNSHLPSKTEQVLFCRLAPAQRSTYQRFLHSQEVADVLDSKTPAFAAITALRRLCNHPCLGVGDLASSLGVHKTLHAKPRSRNDDEGDAVGVPLHRLLSDTPLDALISASGKLIVLDEVLRAWRENGHRCLVFCQGRKMLDIVQAVVSSRGYSFLRMDGTTPVRDRQVLVDTFNADGGPFVFLLTTRVGGVGVNLIGADRVVLYDPDWNPSTDLQARERAWRLGQRRHVTVYRLISTGTIEEKVYQRQVFKMAIAQRVLSDPAQQRLFSYKDLQNLFTLSDSAEGGGVIETQQIVPEGCIDLRQSSGPSSAVSEVAMAAAAEEDSEDCRDGGLDKPDSFAVGGSGGFSFLAGRETYCDPDAARSCDLDGASSEDSGDLKTSYSSASKSRTRRSGRDASAISSSGGPQTSILQALFGQGQLSGALSHDAAELTEQERNFIQKHAAKVARLAAASLPPPPSLSYEHLPGDSESAGQTRDSARVSRHRSANRHGRALSRKYTAASDIGVSDAEGIPPSSKSFGLFGSAVIWQRSKCDIYNADTRDDWNPALCLSDACHAPLRGLLIRGLSAANCFSEDLPVGWLPYMEGESCRALLEEGERLVFSARESTSSSTRCIKPIPIPVGASTRFEHLPPNGIFGSFKRNSEGEAAEGGQRRALQRKVPLVRRVIQRHVVAAAMPSLSAADLALSATMDETQPQAQNFELSPAHSINVVNGIGGGSQMIEPSFTSSAPQKAAPTGFRPTLLSGTGDKYVDAPKPLHSSVILSSMRSRAAASGASSRATSFSVLVGSPGMRSSLVPNSITRAATDPQRRSFGSLLEAMGRRTR